MKILKLMQNIQRDLAIASSLVNSIYQTNIFHFICYSHQQRSRFLLTLQLSRHELKWNEKVHFQINEDEKKIKAIWNGFCWDFFLQFMRKKTKIPLKNFFLLKFIKKNIFNTNKFFNKFNRKLKEKQSDFLTIINFPKA